jgi:hypothetical protein
MRHSLSQLEPGRYRSRFRIVSRKFRNSARLVQTEPASLSGPGGMKCVLSCILFASALADTINLKGGSYACLHGGT